MSLLLCAISLSSVSLWWIWLKHHHRDTETHRELLTHSVLNFNDYFLSPSILDLREMNVQHAALQLGGCVSNTNGPAQRHDPPKLTETTFRTKIGNDPSPAGSSFLFTPDAEFAVGQSDLD